MDTYIGHDYIVVKLCDYLKHEINISVGTIIKRISYLDFDKEYVCFSYKTKKIILN